MRHYEMILRIATACAALCCSAIAPGQNAAARNGATTDLINGNWTVTFTVQGQTLPGQMTFKARGEQLDGRVETQHTGEGTLHGGAWSHNKVSGIYIFESHEAIAIAGELREGKLAGVFRTEGLDGRWEAVPSAPSRE